jgi:hypothetical protein
LFDLFYQEIKNRSVSPRGFVAARFQRSQHPYPAIRGRPPESYGRKLVKIWMAETKKEARRLPLVPVPQYRAVREVSATITIATGRQSARGLMTLGRAGARPGPSDPGSRIPDPEFRNPESASSVILPLLSQTFCTLRALPSWRNVIRCALIRNPGEPREFFCGRALILRTPMSPLSDAERSRNYRARQRAAAPERPNSHRVHPSRSRGQRNPWQRGSRLS